MTLVSLAAETTIGLFKAEAVGRNSPFLTGPLRTLDDVDSTMEWVDWLKPAPNPVHRPSHHDGMRARLRIS